jgi:hypothetical protein
MKKDELKLVAKTDPVAAVERANQEVKKPVAHSLLTKRKYLPDPIETMRQRLQADRTLREQAQQSALPFLHPEAFADFKLVQGLYLVGGVSGKGKSTTAANLLATFCKHGPPGKKAYVITNEEMSDAVLGRVACIELGLSYFRYHKGSLPRQQRNEIDDLAALLLSRIHVVNSPAYDMSCLEDVQAVLEYAAESGDVGMTLIDYHQTIEMSRENPDMESFRVHKVFGSYLKDYGRRVQVPVILFAQLRPDSEGAEMKSRVENDRTIYNHSFAAVEIIPDFETCRTTFKIWKDRFGEVQGKEIEMEFVAGRFQPVGGDSL